MKKYGGVIKRARRFDFPECKDDYGGNLGYVYAGWMEHDPSGRGWHNGPIRTSLVVKDDGDRIETLNTIYDIEK